MTRYAQMLARPRSEPLAPADHAWLAAYGSAFAAELLRLCHGQERVDHQRVGDFVETTRTPIDATAAAKRRATEVADLAVRSLEP